MAHARGRSLPTISVARMAVRIVPAHSAPIVPRCMLGPVQHLFTEGYGERTLAAPDPLRSGFSGYQKRYRTRFAGIFLCPRYCFVSLRRSHKRPGHEDFSQKQMLRSLQRIWFRTLRPRLSTCTGRRLPSAPRALRGFTVHG